MFLRQTAILGRLCAPLCEAVTRAPGGQAMLEQLETANLFLIPLDAERRWYRYHHLFAEVLRARPPPPEAEPVAELHERAAIWYEAEGLITEAIEHALAGGQVERTARLIEQHYEAMCRRNDQRQLERWLKALPAERVRIRPLLSLALAAVYLYDFQFADAEKVLNDGRFDLPEDIAESRDLRGKLLTLLGLSSGMNRCFERSVTLSRQALELLAPSSLAWRSAALISDPSTASELDRHTVSVKCIRRYTPPRSLSGYPESGERKGEQMKIEADRAKHPPGTSSSYRYAIRLEGHLDAHWSGWLEGMTITHEEGGVTLLEGTIVDQSALHGLLGKLGDLCLPILTLQRREPVSGDGSLPEEPSERREVTDRIDSR